MMLVNTRNRLNELSTIYWNLDVEKHGLNHLIDSFIFHCLGKFNLVEYTTARHWHNHTCKWGSDGRAKDAFWNFSGKWWNSTSFLNVYTETWLAVKIPFASTSGHCLCRHGLQITIRDRIWGQCGPT